MQSRWDISYFRISTHTPARGVTHFWKDDAQVASISTHTPARGVTVLEETINRMLTISTHTPARGVTRAVKGV